MGTMHKIAAVITLLPIAACQTATASSSAYVPTAIEDSTPAPTVVTDDTWEDEGIAGFMPRLQGVFTPHILPEKTEARYIVEQEFFGRGLTAVIDVTSIVEGEITIDVDDTPNIIEGEFHVDLRSLTSDGTRRNNAVRGRRLESDQYPFAAFSATTVTDSPTDFGFSEGEEVRFKLHGDTIIRKVIRNIIFDVIAVGSGYTREGRATTQFLMTDFGFDPPSIINLLSAEDEVKVELDFALRNTTP